MTRSTTGHFTMLLIAAISCGLAFPAHAQESPLQRAAVGDFVEYEGSIPALETLKGLGGLAGLDGLDALTGKLKIRYKVTAKTETTATIEVAMFSGDNEMPGRTFDIPLDKPLDPILLTPTADERVKIKLEKKVPNLKYKVQEKEFSGEGYVYKAEMDLFGGAGAAGLEGFDIPGLEGLKEVAKKTEMTLSYFVSPEAPVLGIVVIKMQGPADAKFVLSAGTGVSKLITPSGPAAPDAPLAVPSSPGESDPGANGANMDVDRGYKVGDWMEYQGVERISKKIMTLRHTVKDIAGDGATVTATFSIDGQDVKEWDLAIPVKELITVVPTWDATGELDATPLPSTAAPRNVALKIPGRTLAGVEQTGVFAVVGGAKTQKVFVSIQSSSALPMTGIASMRIRTGTKVDVDLRLSGHSGLPALEKKSR